MTVATLQRLTIHLGQSDTDLPACRELPLSEYGDSWYTAPDIPLSIARLPRSGADYRMGVSRVARTNARWAERLGYRYERIDRADWEDDLYELRSSTPFRQGRPMHPAYMQRQRYGSDRWPEPHCKRHLTTVHGIVSDQDALVAYAQVVQCGEIVRLNTILGHHDHLEHRVMWKLMLDLIGWHIDACDSRYALYYAHDSGHGDGLRYFKERLGFRPTAVEWRFS